MRFKCWKPKMEMKLCLIIPFLTLMFACSYATSIATQPITGTDSISGNDGGEQRLPVKQRTARLVREFPSNMGQRLQTIEFPSYNIPNPYGPGTYAFGYEIEDPQTGNVQFRDEEKLLNGTVRGAYGYLQLDGSVVITRFYTDLYGYHANTEVRQSDGQLVSSFPVRSPAFSASLNRNPLINHPQIYNPALNADYLDPQYTAAILGHIRNQQFNPSQGLIQYPNGIPPSQLLQAQDAGFEMMPYQAPSNGNFFSNFFNQFPSNLSPSNLYNNLQSTFPNVIPQQNPFNTLANNVQNGFQQFTQNNPFGNFVSNAQSQLQQLVPQNNPFANWFNGNRFGQQQQQELLLQQQAGSGLVLGDAGLTAGYLSGHRIPTTKRRRIIATTKRRKQGLKTRDGVENDWLDDFLETRKRQMIYGLTTTPTTVSTAAMPIKATNESS